MAEQISIIIGAQDKFSGAFDKLVNRLPSIKTLAIGAGVAIAGTGTALFAMAKSTATAYDKFQKLSDQLGISTEFLSKHAYAADIAGIKQETFIKSTQMLQVRIGEAARGIGEGKDALDSLGVSLYNTSGQLKTSEEILPELADGFHNMSNATERAEIASKIFGQRGISMLQMFKDGSAGLKDITAEAEKFGLVVSAQAGANAAEFNDSLTRVTGSLTGLKNKMAEEVMPTITGLANRFADFVANNRGQIIDYGIKFLEVMGNITEKGAYGVAILIDSWRGLQMTWEVLKVGFAEFSIALWEGIGWLQEKIVSFMEVMNFGGVFDGAIESASNFTGMVDENIATMTDMSATAMAKIEELAGNETAISKVGEITDTIKNAIAEIRAEGVAEVTGIHPFDDANIEKTTENLEALRALHDEHFLSEGEKLTVWYETELAKYQANAEAKSLIDEIYGKKKADLKSKLDKESIKSEKTTQDGMNAIAQAGSIKGFGILKAAAIPEIATSTQTGAIAAYKAMAGIPIIGPALGAVAAAAVIAYGAIRSATVAGLNVAHGGLDFVPKEQTYLLDKGERVLSPNQNQDLVEFMARGGGETITVENFYFQVPATLDEIKRMDRGDWRELAEDRIIPALRELSTAGIKV